ncbi:MAG: hypothetical protein ABJA98_27945 [Acidobacteriota bacterium]
MTTERAITVIREAQRVVRERPSVAPAVAWDILAAAGATLAARIVEQDAEWERERARAGWPVGCTAPIPHLQDALTDRMALSDAVNVARVLADAGLLDKRDQRELLDAAGALVLYVEQRDRQLQTARTLVQAAARADAPRVEGDVIVSGHDAGGRRDFLQGTPIHAGERLYLLMAFGWMPVRYESKGAAGASLVYLSLPGVGKEIGIAIPSTARFAWPSEIQGLPERFDAGRWGG